MHRVSERIRSPNLGTIKAFIAEGGIKQSHGKKTHGKSEGI